MRSVTEPVTPVVGLPHAALRVAHPELGKAVTRGLELKANFPAALMPAAPRHLRANASVSRPRVDGVPGPDNRIDQQPDGPPISAPTTAGRAAADVGEGQISPRATHPTEREQSASVNGKVMATPMASDRQPRLQGSAHGEQPGPSRLHHRRGYIDASVRETSQTVAPTYLNVQLRLEFKL